MICNVRIFFDILINNKEFSMDITTEKITVSIPSELKRQLFDLKDELHISMSAIFREALESYAAKKEIERWEKGAKLASVDKNYLSFVEDVNGCNGDLYEYPAR